MKPEEVNFHLNNSVLERKMQTWNEKAWELRIFYQSRVQIRNTYVFYWRIQAILFVWRIIFGSYLMAVSTFHNLAPGFYQWSLVNNDNDRFVPSALKSFEVQTLFLDLLLDQPRSYESNLSQWPSLQHSLLY